MGLLFHICGETPVMLLHKLSERLRLIAVVSALGLAPQALLAEPLVIGVGTHFGQGRTNLEGFRQWSSKARVVSLRDDVYWSHVERRSQQLEWQYASREARAAFRALAPAVQPLVVLGGGNGLYDGGHQPSSTEAVEAYANYARWVATELRAVNPYFEVWNEWNIGTSLPGIKSRGDAKGYARLAERAIAQVRSVSPAATVLVGGSTDDFPDWRWVRELVASGLLAQAGGLTVHLYNHCDRKVVGSDELVTRLDSLKRILDSSGLADLPVYVTEVGWPSYRGPCGVSETEAATFTLRFLLEAAARPWLKGVWLYEFMDGGGSDSEREHRFGLLRRNGEEKPSGCVVRAVGSQIAERPNRVFRTGSWTAMLFGNGTSASMLLYRPQAATGTSQVTIRSSTGRLDASVLDICGLAGEAQVLQRTSESLSLRAAGFAPVLVRIANSGGNIELTSTH